MKNLKIAVAATFAAAGVGLGSLMTIPQAVNRADCPYGWYWDDERQNCLPPGLPKDPPNGCLTGDGTHFKGTICVNYHHSNRRRSLFTWKRPIPPRAIAELVTTLVCC